MLPPLQFCALDFAMLSRAPPPHTQVVDQSADSWGTARLNHSLLLTVDNSGLSVVHTELKQTGVSFVEMGCRIMLKPP